MSATKTWQNPSDNPRPEHDIDGETVDINDSFSNGMDSPGDDDAAGCVCYIDVDVTPSDTPSAPDVPSSATDDGAEDEDSSSPAPDEDGDGDVQPPEESQPGSDIGNGPEDAGPPTSSDVGINVSSEPIPEGDQPVSFPYIGADQVQAILDEAAEQFPDWQASGFDEAEDATAAIGDLRAMQPYVTTSTVRSYMEDIEKGARVKAPLAFKKDSKFYVADGHNRAQAFINEGATELKLKILVLAASEGA